MTAQDQSRNLKSKLVFACGEFFAEYTLNVIRYADRYILKWPCFDVAFRMYFAANRPQSLIKVRSEWAKITATISISLFSLALGSDFHQSTVVSVLLHNVTLAFVFMLVIAKKKFYKFSYPITWWFKMTSSFC